MNLKCEYSALDYGYIFEYRYSRLLCIEIYYAVRLSRVTRDDVACMLSAFFQTGKQQSFIAESDASAVAAAVDSIVASAIVLCVRRIYGYCGYLG